VRAALLGALLLAAAAQAQEPRPGVTHDSWQQIALQPVAAGDCLELDSSRHTIRLALADLRVLAVEAGRIMGAQTEPRLQRLFEGRAQALLGRLAGRTRQGDCVQAPAAEGDDRYVVAELLKAGRAAVQRDGANAGSIWMRHLGRRMGPLSGRGDILFYTERGGEPFFAVSWWVS
jgi:hypothetical protein